MVDSANTALHVILYVIVIVIARLFRSIIIKLFIYNNELATIHLLKYPTTSYFVLFT